MQSLGDLFANNKILFVAILVIILAVVGGAVAIASRAMFGRRITTGTGGRTRQPRLGVVDAFDLDRQRQLVIVRRDNVEHLLMIGGPNDLLIETAIVRAAPAAGARDKEAGAPAVIAPSAGAAPIPSPASPSASLPASTEMGDLFAETGKDDLPSPPEPILPLPPPPDTTPTPAPLRGAGPIVQVPPRAPSPLPPRPPLGTPAGTKPIFPPPRPPGASPASRPVTTPTRPGSAGPVAPRTPPETKRAEEPPRAPAGLTDARPDADKEAAAAPAREPAAQPPKPLSSPLRGPRPEVPPTIKATPPLTTRPTPAPSPSAPAVKSLDALESLEEEMAKLLGRPVPPADKS